MKAIINGKQIEGTPQEIAEYERIQAQQKERSIWPQRTIMDQIKDQNRLNSLINDPNTDDWWHSDPNYRIGQMGG